MDRGNVPPTVQRQDPTPRHAKCVVVDRKELFVSSANFTEAAHERNLEIGLMIQSAVLAEQLHGYFDTLIEANLLEQLI